MFGSAEFEEHAATRIAAKAKIAVEITDLFKRTSFLFVWNSIRTADKSRQRAHTMSSVAGYPPATISAKCSYDR